MMNFSKREFYEDFFSNTDEILERYEEVLIIDHTDKTMEVIPKKELPFESVDVIIMPCELKHKPLQFEKTNKIITIEGNQYTVDHQRKAYDGEAVTKEINIDKQIIPSSLPSFVIKLLTKYPNGLQFFIENNLIIGYNHYSHTPIYDSPSYYDLLDNYITACFAHGKLKRTQNLHIKKSTLSRVDNTKISLSKQMLFQSPYLKNGMTFIFNSQRNSGKKISITIWEEDDVFYMVNFDGKLLASRSFFSKEELPQTLNDKSINNLFKKRKDLKRRVENENAKEWANGLFTDINGVMTPRELLLCQVLTANNCFLEFDGNMKYTDISQYVKDDFVMGLKLFCAYNSPELRKNVRVVSEEKSKKVRGRRITHKRRKWVWGTDKITYIYPNNQSNQSKAHHYVRPHFCKFYVKDLDKYADYNPVYEGGKYSIVKWRCGAWKGGSEFIYHDGEDCHGYSRKAIRWLDKVAKEENIVIQHAEYGGEMRVELGENNWYLVDGFCKETNTVYEFHGNIWHGNPRLYGDEDKPHPYSNLTAKELYENTIKKEDILKEMGFNLVVIWEDEWDGVVNA